MLGLLTAPIATSAHVPTPDSVLATQLQTDDEILLSAVHMGDREAWSGLLHPTSSAWTRKDKPPTFPYSWKSSLL